MIDDVLIMQFECSGDSFAIGVSCQDGTTLWERALPQGINWLSPSTLSVEGRRLVVMQTSEQLLILEPETGERVSGYQPSAAAIASPVARDGVVYMTARGLTALRFRPNEMELLWQEDRLGAQRGSPVADRGKIYVVRSSNILVCGDLATGQSLWSLRLKGSQFWATPIVAGDFVYAVSAEGLVQVVNTSGKEPEIVASNDMQQEVLGSPAISDGAIYLRGVQHLWKIGR
jgi:outer membrane protein assembly factor BamB